MSSLADRTIDSLRSTYEELAEVVADLTAEQLTGSSADTEWTIADVLSHMGSGAEIMLATLKSTVTGADAPAADFNQGVWDRWNAMSPQDQASGYLAADAELVATLEELDAAQRATVQVKLGFLPTPLGVASFGAMRLNESAHHSWDVRVALDSNAAVAPDAADLLAEHFCGDLGMLLGFIAKTDKLSEPTVVAIAGSPYSIVIGEKASITNEKVDTTATFNGPLESAVRMITGRLKPGYTSASIVVDGNVTLDELRQVFPGF